MKLKLAALTCIVASLLSVNAETIQESAYDRGLVKTQITAREILNNHEKFSNITQHSQTFADGHAAILGFVTPWNGLGYDVAKIFRGKFTHISPVWFQIKFKDGQPVIEGEHDVDKGWMEVVRKKSDDGRRAQIVPRFEFLNWEKDDWIAFIQGPDAAKLQGQLLTLIEQCIQRNGFDGVVLESGIPGYLVNFFAAAVQVLKQVLVVVPAEHAGRHDVNAQVIAALLEGAKVSHVIVMTYDYSRFLNTPGPNAPVEWMEKNVETLIPSSSHRQQLMLGLPMYGYDYIGNNAEAITAPTFVKILSQSPKISWDDEAEEHTFAYTDELGRAHLVYYPTLKFFDSRIALAEELGTSLALWEIGQGMLYFYELL